MTDTKKNRRYQRLYAQLSDLAEKSAYPLSQMATINALLYHKIDYFFWCGFYEVKDKHLAVVSYQGPLACQLLPQNKGVCWAAVNENKTIIVPDVEAFPGHIACSSLSKSEIVVPVRNKEGKPVAVLDVDSKEYGSFDETDALYLEKIVQLIHADTL
ncbi:MAG TPA: GAF domain-containing protein [Bacteroidales bacterium]|nr:GAF domain-containing protein [Bacteroidales bacterium]HNZ43805.1 GAF domain-containing protein [Bacteroidales bacterium]HOH84406.1 GAF domain-containing protein [Bacteroidales bacterium]HPB26464.1 GAF domain-containing protein [Bacteroidales bacterium]HPI29657.1 GAF domain-containing protein [Bacteroidales bacterium]